ncbi:DNA polymerase theta (polymerase domain only), putative [Leishmania donovani]|uniref:DNA-directed DNA polymerase n=1 Tax=Leishmania donovani TaxID=5661 RepID=E9BGV4_LEIDO|nr:DNA polymerase theta (polymerase domain only), putative [Leishmania donovani]AYU79173.1 DNA polymerase theta (polymerase domain only), putative [Leishmania donovani]CBZ34480.1 DNA polymerase theta (polymerase domain only), putative [Leishmania donovani]
MPPKSARRGSATHALVPPALTTEVAPSPPPAEPQSHRGRTRQESALLFWLEAACAAPVSRSSTNADRASASSSSTTAAAATPVAETKREPSVDLASRPPPEEQLKQQPWHGGASTQQETATPEVSAAAGASAAEAPSTFLVQTVATKPPPPPPGEMRLGGDTSGSRKTADAPPTPGTEHPAPLPHLSWGTGPRRLVVADAVPLFDSLLAGRLGPVAVDVQLQGHTRLSQQPQQFEAALQAYERQSTGALREALSSVQPFFLLCNAGGGADMRVNHSEASGGGMDDDGHPQPAHGAAVLSNSSVLYTMDPASNYPVLPLLAQLLRAPQVTKLLLHSRLLYRLLFLFLGTDRVELSSVVDLPTWAALGQQLRPSLALLFHLPIEGVASLSDITAVLPSEARQLLHEETQSMAQKQPLHATRPVGSESDSELDSVQEASTDGSDGAGDKEDGGDDARREGGDARAVAADGTAEDEPADAVQLLQRIRPLAEQPLGGNSRNASGADFDSAARAVGVKRRLLRSRQRHRRRRYDSGPSLSSSSCANAPALADVYHGLRTITLFYVHVLSRLLDVVDPGATGVAAPSAGIAALSLATSRCGGDAIASPVSAVRYRFSPSELCALRTYADFLCELMAYHGVFVNDTVAHGMLTALDVQMAAIEDLGLRVAVAVLAATEPAVPSAIAEKAEGRQWSIEMVYKCLARLTAAATTPEMPRAVNAHYLRLLAAQAKQSSCARAEQLRLGCQLVCVWMAYLDRATTRNRLHDMFRKVADKLHVCVLEKPRDSAVEDGPAVSDASTAQVSRVCYSMHPNWVLHNKSTGRIFSALPNVQNLPKQPPRTTFPIHALSATPSRNSGGDESLRPYGYVDPPTEEDVDRWLSLAEAAAVDQASSVQFPLFPENPQWTLRHLYCAPPGCLLASFDFNQLELRLLAHLSGDAALQEHLSANVDVLALVTASVLRLPSIDHVRPQQRQAVKVIVYGLLYGMGPESMDVRIKKINEEFATSEQQQHRGEAASSAPAPMAARDLLRRFHRVYPRIENYLRETRQEALRSFAVETLSGRKSLIAEKDANRRRQRAIAQAVQGGAADVLHSAMRAVHQQRHSFLPYLPAAPLALVMSIHDELVYAVPRVAIEEVVRGVQRILEDQARVLRLAVPLPVSARVGHCLGELAEFRPTGG